MMPIDPKAYDWITFDCYGTLVDWETGILSALEPVIAAHGVSLDDRRLLEAYAELESEAESGDYLPYREVLGRVVDGIGRRLSFAPTAAERASLADSIRAWKPFPDTVAALSALKRRFRLGIVSNVDGDIFTGTAAALEVPFDRVVTAQSARAYKPAHAIFEEAFRRIGAPRDRILHAAQSLFHDVAPARALGLATVHVDRRSGRGGTGATAPSEARPDWTVPDLKGLAKLLGAD